MGAHFIEAKRESRLCCWDFSEAKCKSRLCRWDFREAKRKTVPDRDFCEAKRKSRLCHWDFREAKRETVPVRDFSQAKRESRLCHWDFCEAKRETVPPRDFTQAKCESFRPRRATEKALPYYARKCFPGARFVESELILPGKFVLFIGLLFSPRRVMNVSRPENGPPPRAGKAAGQGRHIHENPNLWYRD